MKRENKYLIAYLGIVLVLTTALLLLAQRTGSELAGALSQATPALGMLALAFLQFGKKAPSELGLTKFGNVGWYLFALLVPGLVVAASFALSYATGFAQFIGQGGKSLPAATLLAIGGKVGKNYLLSIFVTLPLPLLWSATEELGWRAYMQPILMKKGGFALGSLLSGLAWGLYHLLFIVTGNYFEGGNTVVHVLSLTVLSIVLSFIMGAIRLRTKSVYPAILFHAEINVAQLYFGQWIFEFTKPEGVYLSGEAGFINIALWLAVLLAVALVAKPTALARGMEESETA